MGCGDMETKRLCKINLCVHSHCGILCVLCYIEVFFWHIITVSPFTPKERRHREGRWLTQGHLLVQS